MNPQPEPIYTGPPMQTMSTVKPVDNKSSASSTLRNRNNVIFAVAIILYEILALPIYGVLFRLSDSLTLYQDQWGLLIVSIASIFILIGTYPLIQVWGSSMAMLSDLRSLELLIR